MLTFLFWNIHGNYVAEVLGELALEHRVDVLVLAESKIPSDQLARSLSAGNDARFHYAAGREPTRVEFFTKFAPEYLTPILEDARYSIRRLRLPGHVEITIAAAHLLSPLRAPMSRPSRARQFATDIRQAEQRAGDYRTVLFGDLNMNPFDEGVAAVDALNGVMSRQTAQKIRRRHAGTDYAFFYNPMWARMGSSPDRVPGTYYYDKSDEPRYYWNVFDQVLIRPTLLDYWNDDDLRVLTGVGNRTFLTGSGIPNAREYSDHLPLLFRLDL